MNYSLTIIYIAINFRIFQGFGTKDASKTDEFCNNIRMEQYRQVLRKEAQASKKSMESNAKRLKELRGFSLVHNLHIS